MAERSLEELMASYVAGERQAFDELYARTCRRVFAFLLAMTADRARAEDLCQLTYLKLHRARGAWLDGSPLVPWLMAIARNSLYDDVRARGRQRVELTPSGRSPDSIDERIVPEGLRDALSNAIAALSPLHREAFVLTKQSGLSPREAAHVLGTTETAVKLRVHRAYLALRAALASYRSEES